MLLSYKLENYDFKNNKNVSGAAAEGSVFTALVFVVNYFINQSGVTDRCYRLTGGSSTNNTNRRIKKTHTHSSIIIRSNMVVA